jgi:hypothetical protein
MPALKFGLAEVRLGELTLNPLSGNDLEPCRIYAATSSSMLDLQSVHCRADIELSRMGFHLLQEASSDHDVIEVGGNPAVREDQTPDWLKSAGCMSFRDI